MCIQNLRRPGPDRRRSFCLKAYVYTLTEAAASSMSLAVSFG
jgi:hypothetical protein